MILIAALGKQSSGKGELAKVAGEKGFEIIQFRSAVIAEAKRRNIDKGTLTLTYTGDLMRKEHGQAAVAFAVGKMIRKSPADKIFLEGLRSAASIDYLRSRFPNLKVVGIIADEKTRLERALRRNRSDDPKTIEEKLRKEQIENTWGIDKALKKADYIIDNNSTLEDFRKTASALLEQITGEQNA